MFSRFTDRARKVMALANQEAKILNSECIGTEHILLGLLRESSGVGANVLKNIGVDPQMAYLEAEKVAKHDLDTVNAAHERPAHMSFANLVREKLRRWCCGLSRGKLPQTPGASEVIAYAIEEARALNHNYIGTEHLLLGLLRKQDGRGAQVLTNLGIKSEDVRQEVLTLLGLAK